MEINDAINEINTNYNYPGLTKLIKLVQSKYKFSKEDIIKNEEVLIDKLSKKIIEAKKLNIPIITLYEFKKKYNFI